VRAGDVIGPLAVEKVGSGRVVITGMDTTWVLQVREPWKN
jgi:heme/copper-type cytochrome/quinol oxidase subunit 2